MNLRPPFTFPRRVRATLTALETPSLTSAAVLGSVAWIGTAVPAAAVISPFGHGGQSDSAMSLASALIGIDDRAARFGVTRGAAVHADRDGLPTLARLQALQGRIVPVFEQVLADRAKPPTAETTV